MPARLGLLQNAQPFHFADRSIRTAGPGMRAGERETRGHEQGRYKQRHGHKIRAPKVETCAQAAGDERTQESAGGNRPTHIPNVPQGKQRGQRKQQQPKAGNRRNLRIDRPAAEPPPAQNQNRGRQQKRRKAENLEK